MIKKAQKVFSKSVLRYKLNGFSKIRKESMSHYQTKISIACLLCLLWGNITVITNKIKEGPTKKYSHMNLNMSFMSRLSDEWSTVLTLTQSKLTKNVHHKNVNCQKQSWQGIIKPYFIQSFGTSYYHQYIMSYDLIKELVLVHW